ncbi:hypothetical protein NMY22_g375 [Coprinellus aureogranulatus]|nr:hypothetical protein NMY22_g375 [Coprinellus aureogranulatus]
MSVDVEAEVERLTNELRSAKTEWLAANSLPKDGKHRNRKMQATRKMNKLDAYLSGFCVLHRKPIPVVEVTMPTTSNPSNPTPTAQIIAVATSSTTVTGNTTPSSSDKSPAPTTNAHGAEPAVFQASEATTPGAPADAAPNSPPPAPSNEPATPPAETANVPVPTAEVAPLSGDTALGGRAAQPAAGADGIVNQACTMSEVPASIPAFTDGQSVASSVELGDGVKKPVVEGKAVPMAPIEFSALPPMSFAAPFAGSSESSTSVGGRGAAWDVTLNSTTQDVHQWGQHTLPEETRVHDYPHQSFPSEFGNITYQFGPRPHSSHTFAQPGEDDMDVDELLLAGGGANGLNRRLEPGLKDTSNFVEPPSSLYLTTPGPIRPAAGSMPLAEDRA